MAHAKSPARQLQAIKSGVVYYKPSKTSLQVSLKNINLANANVVWFIYSVCTSDGYDKYVTKHNIMCMTLLKIHT